MAVFEENELDHREKPQQITFFLRISAYEWATVGNIFQNVFIEYDFTKRILSIETSMEEIQSAVLKINAVKLQKEQNAPNFGNFSHSDFWWKQ